MDEPTHFYSYIGHKIKQLRDLHGMSKTHLSQKVETSVKNISDYESGLKSIPVHIFFRISQEFNISINELLSGYHSDLKK